MKEIFDMLPILFIAITMNVFAGLYYNIENRDMKFDIKKLINGLIKAGIIAGIFIGMAFCFEKTDLSSIGVTPMFMMTSVITLYISKTLISFSKILGIKIKIDDKGEE